MRNTSRIVNINKVVLIGYEIETIIRLGVSSKDRALVKLAYSLLGQCDKTLWFKEGYYNA